MSKQDQISGSAKGGQVNFIEAIRQGIHEEMTRDETVFVIGEDIGAYGGAFKLMYNFLRKRRQDNADSFA